jgi:hypothetical protein
MRQRNEEARMRQKRNAQAKTHVEGEEGQDYLRNISIGLEMTFRWI